MKVKTYHISNFGSLAPRGVSQENGYVKYHDSPRYSDSNLEQLHDWANSNNYLIRNAARTELAERNVQTWQES